MKATFNFQIKMDDRQTAVLFRMEECKGVDIEVMSNLTKLFSETKVKIAKLLEKPVHRMYFIQSESNHRPKHTEQDSNP